MELNWNDDKTLSIVKGGKKPRKLTGTRFASIFGLNKWNTPFQTWCEITGAYRKPFEETQYTMAGKVVEPKQAAYLRESYGMDDLIDPTMEYGPDPFKVTWGDFFPDSHPFGGMWDALVRDDDGDVELVVEFKTTKRVEDWVNADGEVEAPEYYALQAALYAYLLGCDDVAMPVTFLKDEDYNDIESFEVDSDNTTVFTFSMSERYPNFEGDYIEPAIDWWNEHVETGVSPVYDERVDDEYLKALKTAAVGIEGEDEVNKLLEELAQVHARVVAIKAKAAPDEKREKEIKEKLKLFAKKQIGDKQYATFSHAGVTCKLARSTQFVIDEEALKEDGRYEDYAVESESSKFTVKYDD